MILYAILSYTPFSFELPLSALFCAACAVVFSLMFRRTGSAVSLALFVAAVFLTLALLVLFADMTASICLVLLLAAVTAPRKGATK